MLNYKQRVMEDLDALLADLQSTTAHISSFQQQQAEQEQYQNRRPDIVSSQSSPRTSTPSPLPSQLTDHNDTSQLRRNDKAHGCPSLKQHIVQENSTHHHHHHHLHHHQQQQQQQQQHHHSYSSERTSSSSSNSGATYHQERSSASSTLSQSSLPGLSPVGYNKPIGSGSVSSGSNSSLGANASSQMSSTINSNLSELDQLLQDLNSAHFLDEVNRRTNSNQSQFVNGNSQRVVTSPGQVPSSTGSQPVQPPVAPKPNRVETNNRANVDAMLHELDHGVPPPPAGGHSVPDSQRRFVHESSPIPVIVISEPASVSEETGHRQPPLPSPPLPMPPSYSASVGEDPYEDPRQTGATTQMSSTTPPPPLPPSSLPLSQPFPGFPHMESAVTKQSMQSSTSDGNYSSFQSSETVKSSSVSTHSTSADDTCSTAAFTGGLVDVPSAFVPVHPLGPAPVISEQMESKSSQSYSKLESTDSKSEVMQKSEQSTMERSEKYAMSSSTLQQQQQHQLPQLQQPPLMMMMMSNKMQSEGQGQGQGHGLPVADMSAPPFPVQQSYETKSEQSHIYKKIEHSDVSQGFPCPPPPPLAPSAQPIPLQIGTGQADSYYQQQQYQQQQQQDSSPGYQVLSPFQSSQHYESSVSEQQQQHQQQQQQEVVTSSMQQHSSTSASDNFQSRQMAGVNSAATTVGQHAQIGGQVYGQNATYIQQPLYQETPMMSPQTASTATRELDELMASLSEFRVSNRDNSVAQQVAGGDPAYARPHKIRNESAGTATSAATSSMSATSMTAKGDQLDSMLGSLQSDMNRQGVSTKTKGLCAACNKPVVSQMITALGKVWHVEHFTCAHCTMTLGTMSFYERDNKAYCEKDYHSLFAPRCAYCNGPIVDKCVTALDKTWHPEHFFCGLCGRNFGDEGFHERDGQAYCREDFLKMFAPKCGGCAQPIKDSYISALNRHWHPDCFVCWQCQVPFGNTSFFDHDGLPYCEQHYHAKRGSLCSDCQQPITGPSIIAMGRKFHPKHFTCAFCRKQLNNVTFKEQNEKPYCHPCFSKLFAGTKMMD